MLSLTSVLGHSTGEATYQFQAAFFYTLVPLWAVGAAKTMSNLGSAFSFYFGGKIIDKVRPIRLFIIGNLFSRVTNFTSLIFPSVLSPFIMSLNSLFFGAIVVAREQLLQKEFTEIQRATMGSLNSLMSNIFLAIFSFGIGLFADKFGGANALISINVIQLGLLYMYKKLGDYLKNEV